MIRRWPSWSRVRRSTCSAPRAKAKPAGKRLVIVGGSIGGHTAAQTARALDPTAQITLVTDEKHSFYNRLNLTRFLAEEVQHDELFDYTHFGVLELTLHPTSYDWSFVAIDGTVVDSGTEACSV